MKDERRKIKDERYLPKLNKFFKFATQVNKFFKQRIKRLKMDFEGKAIQFLGETSGTGKTGKPWKKKEWLVETFGQYPRKVKLQCFNDRADNLIIEPGKDYIFSVDLESREFNGRWYTDVSVFRVQDFVGQAPNFMPQNPGFQGGYAGQPQAPYPAQGYGAPQAPNYGAPQTGGYPTQGESFTPAAGEGDEDLPF